VLKSSERDSVSKNNIAFKPLQEKGFFDVFIKIIYSLN